MMVKELVDTITEARVILKNLSIYVDEHPGEVLEIGDLYNLIDVKQSFRDLITIIEDSEIKIRIGR